MRKGLQSISDHQTNATDPIADVSNVARASLCDRWRWEIYAGGVVVARVYINRASIEVCSDEKDGSPRVMQTNARLAISCEASVALAHSRG
jgi:hypothetical protein